MAEIPSGEKPIQDLLFRAEELGKQCKVSQLHADEFLVALDGKNPSEMAIGIRGFEVGGELQKRSTDLDWVQALRELGIPAIVANRIWDKKDAIARELKNPPEQENPNPSSNKPTNT